MGDKLSEFLGRWNTPAGWMILFGAIVWGIQLNYTVIQLVDTLAEERAARLEMTNTLTEIVVTQAKTTVLIDNMMKRVERIDQHVDDHDREAEKWKDIILQNKSDIDNLRPQPNNWRNNSGYR